MENNWKKKAIINGKEYTRLSDLSAGDYTDCDAKSILGELYVHLSEDKLLDISQGNSYYLRTNIKLI